MKLFLSTTSPFARLVVITAFLKKINLDLQFVMPWDNPAELLAVNPFCQVPTLISDSGQVITESCVILAYLAPELFSDEKTASQVSFAFGIINQAVRAFGTKRFQPANSEPHPFIARSEQFLLDTLPHVSNLNADSNDWGQIFLGIALSYVQLRLPHVYEKAVSSDNKQVVEQFKQRDFMQKTDSTNLEHLPNCIAQL